MELILYKDQHGFCRNRSIQTASLPILEAIHDAERTGRSLQLLSIHLKAAFDTITPQIIYKEMQMEKFSEIYTEALKQLMETGHGIVFVNDLLGPSREIVSGDGQGNPPSVSTFNIGSDSLLRVVNHETQEYRP
jgi:hypothetical protein